MMKFMNNSKKGVTLVESVFAVVILSILTIGIITLLTAGGIKIYEISGESAAYSKATQKMDLLIASISNGSSDYITYQAETEDTERKCNLNTTGIETELGVTINTSKTRVSMYDGTTPAIVAPVVVHNVRGWYITFTYDGVVMSGFAANSEGVFD